jgi:hypothetical protein
MTTTIKEKKRKKVEYRLRKKNAIEKKKHIRIQAREIEEKQRLLYKGDKKKDAYVNINISNQFHE